MGANLSKLCCQCFIEEQQERDPDIPLLDISHKSSFTSSSTVDLSETPEYRNEETHPKQDYFFKLIEDASIEFLLHIRGDFEEEGFVETLKKENIRVLTKETSSGFVIKSEVTMNCDPKHIIDLILDVKNRKSWDENVERIELVSNLLEDTTVTYVKYKKMLVVSSRDAVMVNRVFKANGGIAFVSTSCELDEFPVLDDTVRAKVEVAGYWIEKVSENKSRIIGYTAGDAGGKIPKAIVKMASATALPRFINAMQKAVNSRQKN